MMHDTGCRIIESRNERSDLSVVLSFSSSGGPWTYFLTALVIAWLGAFQWILMCWLIEKVGK
jgi:hypothetical protein